MRRNRINISTIERDLFALFILLSCIGIVSIYSASSLLRPNLDSNSFFLTRHIIWILIGIISGYIVYKIPLGLIKKYSIHILVLSIFLVFLGSYLNPTSDAGRWLFYRNGAKSFTTSDLSKIALLVYIAWFLEKYKKNINNISVGHFKFLFGIAILLLSIINQPDMSTTILFSLTFIILVFIGGLKLKYLSYLISVGISFIFLKIISTPYMLDRILGLFSKESASNYQVSRALMAMGSAGFWGKGLGDGILKKGFIPEIQGDFIFSVIGEEFGFIFEVVLISLFALLFIRGLQLAQKAPNHFSMFLVIGISINFFLYVFVNIGYVTQLLPTTGLALPFISYGGTHTVSNFILIGLLFIPHKVLCEWSLWIRSIFGRTSGRFCYPCNRE